MGRDMATARIGPRPLSAHLGAASAVWLGALAGLGAARSGAMLWAPALAGEAATLCDSLLAADAAKLSAALANEVAARHTDFLAGIEAYWAHPYRRKAVDMPVLWQEGNVRLLDMAPSGTGARVLLVPSLVNKAYVLDLAPKNSLTAYLASRRLRPLLLDWGEPRGTEQAFDLSDYIVQRLCPALKAAAAVGPVPVVGYCMGGTLAVAAAERRPELVAGLALLATPWDFFADAAGGGALRALGPLLEAQLAAAQTLSVDALQACFAALQPMQVADKFRAFAGLDSHSDAALRFVQIEDWLNDGVPLAAPVARECLLGWYGENTPAREQWCIDGAPVRPTALQLPCLALIPERDRIVPAASASALANAIAGADSRRVPVGHIGMVVGSRAEATCWRPLADWIEGVAT